MIVGRQAGSGSQTRCPGAKKGRALQYGPPPIDGKPAKAKPALGLRAAGSNSPWLVQLSRGSGSSVLGPTDGFKAAAFDRLSQEAKGPWRTMRARGLLRRKKLVALHGGGAPQIRRHCHTAENPREWHPQRSRS